MDYVYVVELYGGKSIHLSGIFSSENTAIECLKDTNAKNLCEYYYEFACIKRCHFNVLGDIFVKTKYKPVWFTYSEKEEKYLPSLCPEQWNDSF